jgi:hypothetical protein
MRIHQITEAIGPHNFQELELMIQGVKPAALADADQMAKWWPAIKKYGWTAELITGEDGYKTYAIARDPAKAQEIKTLLTNMWKGKVPMGSKNVYYAKLGHLLGYSAGDIAHFVLRTGVVGSALWDGTARVLGQLGKVLAPVARVAGGVGAALALHSGELGAGEDEEMAKRRASWASQTPAKPEPNTVTTVGQRAK